MDTVFLSTASEGLRSALPILLDWGLKAAVVFAAAGLLTTLMRRRSASHRHFVWGTAVVGVLALPLFAAVAPTWRLPLPELSPQARGGGGLALPASAGSDEAVGAVEAVGAQDQVARPPTERTGADALAAALAISPEGALEEATVAPAAVRSEPGLGSASAIRWTALIVPVWLTGTVLVLFSVLASLGQATRLTRRTRPAGDQRLLMLGNECVERLGIHRPVRLMLSDDQAMPMTWGAFRPVVVLPAAVTSWSTARIRTVLLHELAHVRRFDFVTQLVARLVCAVHWMNPLAWVAARKLREERELACDDVVLRHGARASDYADHLLDIARSLRSGHLAAVATVAMARPSQLSDRLLAVLDASRTRGGLTGRSGLFGTLAAALVVLPIAAASPSPSPSSTPGSEGGGGGEEGRAELVPSLPSSPDPDWSASGTPEAVRLNLVALCDWTRRGEHRNGSSMNVDDDHATIAIVADDCRLEIEYRGEIEYAADDSDVTAISRGGYFLIEERVGSERREVEIRAAGNGTLERKWFVNRDERPWDAEAAAWLAEMLPVMFRHTGLHAEVRAARILDEGGPAALFREIALIPSDHAARKYYGVLLSRPHLDADVVRQAIDDAATRIDSDHEMGQLLRTIAEHQPMDEAVRIAYVRAAGTLGSDHEHRRVLSAILNREGISRELADEMLRSAQAIDSDFELGRLLRELLAAHPLDETLTPAFFEAFGNIDSDHEQRRVLQALLEQGTPSRAILDRTLEQATRIGSDHERGRLLLQVAELYPMDGPLPDSYVQAARDIGSSTEQSRVLRALLERDALSGETLASILAVSEHIDSDHELSRVLRTVLDRQRLHAHQGPTFFRAMATIGSDHEAGRVLTAVIDAGYTNAVWVNGVLEGALQIGSDHTLGQLLIHIAQKDLVTDGTRDAFMRALDTIQSEHTRGRVLSALYPRGRPAE